MATLSSDRREDPQPPIQRQASLGFLTLGHAGIHWYQQLFPVILPYIKAELGLTDIQVGGLTTVKEASSGMLNLPSGFLADAWIKHRAAILACALAIGGITYFVASTALSYIWGLVSLALLGLSSAL